MSTFLAQKNNLSLDSVNEKQLSPLAFSRAKMTAPAQAALRPPHPFSETTAWPAWLVRVAPFKERSLLIYFRKK